MDVLDRIRKTLVGLKMPRALEVLDQAVRQLERGETSALEVIDTLFAEELTLRENRRVKMALRMAKLSTVKTLAGFDFSFQPSLDRNRILALAQLDFIGRNEVIHFLGPPGTGKSHLATALGVEAVKAGRSVYFASLADIVSVLAKAEREGQLRERIRFLCRPSLLIVDEIGYLPVIQGGGNLGHCTWLPITPQDDPQTDAEQHHHPEGENAISPRRERRCLQAARGGADHGHRLVREIASGFRGWL